MFGFLVCVFLYTISVLVLGVSITAGLFVFHVAVVPLVFKYSEKFRRGLIFANFVQWPFPINYNKPSLYGLVGTRNLNINYRSKVDNCDIKIGIWHILPKSTYKDLEIIFDDLNKEKLNELLDKELRTSKKPIILYCHGNSNSRASAHRIKLYKFFQEMDFHTIAFDYRGYGDSTYVSPSEYGVVEDAFTVYHWLTRLIENESVKPAIFVWGHSLGTGISSHLLGDLSNLSKQFLGSGETLGQPNGLILEAPFNNLADEVAKHPLSKLVTWLPYYETTFVEPFKDTSIYSFKSDKYLSNNTDLPVLILHAKDDVIVPFVVGVKLYNTITESRKNGGAEISLHAFESKEGLGHKWICDAPDLNRVLGDFVAKHVTQKTD